MPRKLLLFAALAVVGSVLVLWLATRGSKADDTGNEPVAITRENGEVDLRGNRPRLPASDPAANITPTESGEVRPPRDNLGQPRETDPSRPQSATVEATERGTVEAQKPFKEYTLPDGRRVRDFRDPSKSSPMEIPPSIHPPGGRRIKPELTGLFTDQILAHMRECGKAVPKSALVAPKPRLEGQIVIAIKAQQAGVTSAVINLNGVDASHAESAKQCITQKTLTVKVPAADEQDLDAYSINLSFVFP